MNIRYRYDADTPKLALYNIGTNGKLDWLTLWVGGEVSGDIGMSCILPNNG